MDIAKIQDFKSLINRLRQKTLSFSVLKSLLRQVSLSLLDPFVTLTLSLATTWALESNLEPPIPLVARA